MCNIKNKTEARVAEINRLNDLIASFFSMYNNILNSTMLDETEKEIKSEAVMREIEIAQEKLTKMS